MQFQFATNMPNDWQTFERDEDNFFNMNASNMRNCDLFKKHEPSKISS